MQLTSIHRMEGTLRLVTGLHIGAGSDEMHIGGIDNPVLKHPYTNEPYIPGSSLKGKMRALLEWRAGLVGISGGKPVDAKVLKTLNSDAPRLAAAEQIAQAFGIAGDANDSRLAERLGPTRLGFWDCELDSAWVKARLANNEQYTEVKSETAIDRITGVAGTGTLRQSERVPSGAVFRFRLSLKELDSDGDRIVDFVLMGLKLLELDGIGGSGSRGYGKIAFDDLTLDGVSIQQRFADRDAFAA